MDGSGAVSRQIVGQHKIISRGSQEVQGNLPHHLMVLVPLRKEVSILPLVLLRRFIAKAYIMIRSGYRAYSIQPVPKIKALGTLRLICIHIGKFIPALSGSPQEVFFIEKGPVGSQEKPLPSSPHGFLRLLCQQRHVHHRGIGVQGIVLSP